VKWGRGKRLPAINGKGRDSRVAQNDSTTVKVRTEMRGRKGMILKRSIKGSVGGSSEKEQRPLKGGWGSMKKVD